MSTSWQALVRGEAQERCWSAINAIQRDVDHGAVADSDWGRPLLQMYLALAGADGASRERTEELVDRAAANVESTQMPAALYGGVAGVAWLCSHAGGIVGGGAPEQFDEVDEFLAAACGPDAKGTYDLIGGMVGVGVYFLERLPARAAVEGLKRVIDRLASTAERTGAGVSWFTPPEHVPPLQRHAAPHGYYNLGVAHGVPGVIGLLAQAASVRELREQSLALLAPTVEWVLAQQLEDGLFSYWLTPSRPSDTARVSWCYGELGLSACLLHAALALSDPKIKQRAIQIARRSARRRSAADHKASDACLCHGAAGNAHIFNRLYQCTGDPEVLDAALFWYDMVLAMRLPAGGVGGFRAWKSSAVTDEGLGWEDDSTFLTGASGIALALLAAVTPIEPAWDRVLLVNAPAGLGFPSNQSCVPTAGPVRAEFRTDRERRI